MNHSYVIDSCSRPIDKLDHLLDPTDLTTVVRATNKPQKFDVAMVYSFKTVELISPLGALSTILKTFLKLLKQLI